MNQHPPTSEHESTLGAPRQVVRSPEQVVLDLSVAGPSSRMLAYLIDYIAIVLIEILLFLLMLSALPIVEYVRELSKTVLEEISAQDPSVVQESSAILILFSMIVVLQLVVEWGYFRLLRDDQPWALVGQGGRRSAGRWRRGACTSRLRESLARNLLRAVDILPGYYVVGLVAMIVSPEGKRLGDLAAGTVVIRLDRPTAAAPLREADLVDLGRFRFDRDQMLAIGNVERRLIRQTLRRLEELPPEQAKGVLERTVEVLTRRMGRDPIEPGERFAFLQALLLATERRN